MADRITLFAEVLLPIPVSGTFTYRVPFALNDQVRVGQRAMVQFGKTKIMSGLIVGLTEQVPSVEVKFLLDLLDDQPIVNDRQLKFWDWVKTYYMCHPGEVMQAALPSALKLSSETTVALSPLATHCEAGETAPTPSTTEAVTRYSTVHCHSRRR